MSQSQLYIVSVTVRVLHCHYSTVTVIYSQCLSPSYTLSVAQSLLCIVTVTVIHCQCHSYKFVVLQSQLYIVSLTVTSKHCMYHSHRFTLNFSQLQFYIVSVTLTSTPVKIIKSQCQGYTVPLSWSQAQQSHLYSSSFKFKVTFFTGVYCLFHGHSHIIHMYAVLMLLNYLQ